MLIQPNQLQQLDSLGFQSLLNILSELSNIWLKFVDSHGELILSSHRQQPCGFCRLIRSTPKGMTRCRASALKSQQQYNGSIEPFYYRCHAGLTQLAVPIMCKEKQIGALICGEIVPDDRSEKDLDLILKQTADLNLDGEALRNAFFEIPTWTNSKLHLVGELLSTTSLCLAQVNDTVLKDIRLEHENSLKTMEIKMLQSQINPHFLFNSLNAICMLSLMENAPRTQEMITALSNLLKNNLRSDRPLVPLHEELSVVDDYLLIQSRRFGSRLVVRKEVDLDPALLGLEIPTMTLQPIIENSFTHGLESQEGQVVLSIKAIADRENLTITVEDNGKGIDNNKLLAIQDYLAGHGNTTEKGIGLYNVNKRIQLLFGPDYGVSVDSIAGEGTKVIIYLPHFIYSTGEAGGRS